jgi:tetratricopeptide (TPR) repeat protein
MNPFSQSSLELIDKYLLGQLTQAEQETFDQEIQKPEFQQALEDQRALHNAFKAHGREQMTREMNHWEKEMASLSTSTKILSSRWVYLTGALAAAFALIWLFYPPGSNQVASPEKLFADNFSSFPNIVSPTVRDGQSLIGNNNIAFGYYDDKKYAKAYEAFTALPDSARDSRIEFYRGISALGSGQPDKALLLFRQINQQPESRFYKEAAWYAALAHLKKDESQEAIEYLNWIGDNLPHPFEKEAQNLLEQLSQ